MGNFQTKGLLTKWSDKYVKIYKVHILHKWGLLAIYFDKATKQVLEFQMSGKSKQM